MVSSRLVLASSVLWLAATVSSLCMHAQSLPTATRGAEITAFGGYSPSTTVDFGPSTRSGFLAGADYTLLPPLHFDPSVEARFTEAHATGISEHTFLIGPRVQKDLLNGRLHPYADFLFGRGTIDYHPVLHAGEPSDSGRALSYGGGIDFSVTRHFSLKMDFQQQSWNLGTNAYFKPQGGDYTLTPRMYTFGLTYHFTFADLKGDKARK